MSITLLILFLPFQTTVSDFVLLSVDISLWELMTKVRWGSHDLSSGERFPGVSDHAGTTEHPLSGGGMGGDMGKPQWDMIFLLIAISTTSGYKRVFGFVAVWAHPCQACHQTLAVAAHKLALLVDESVDWAYTFAQLNEGLSHVTLLSKGYISTMTDGMHSADACGWLHQLQICKLL